MSLLDQVRKLEQQVVDRLKELEPLTREYEQLRKLAERLGVKYSSGSSAGDGGAKPSTASGRGRADASTRTTRTPAKTQARRAAESTRKAKPATTSRGTRASTAGRRSASRSEAAGAGGTGAASSTPKRAASRPRRSGGRRTAPARPGPSGRRGPAPGVTENPGITVREIGDRLGVDATGLYRVAKRLTDAGRVRKDGPRLYPVDSATAPSSPQTSDGGTSQSPPSEPAGTPEGTAAEES